MACFYCAYARKTNFCVGVEDVPHTLAHNNNITSIKSTGCTGLSDWALLSHSTTFTVPHPLLFLQVHFIFFSWAGDWAPCIDPKPSSFLPPFLPTPSTLVSTSTTEATAALPSSHWTATWCSFVCFFFLVIPSNYPPFFQNSVDLQQQQHAWEIGNHHDEQ